jgi:hypothetical protein
MQRLLAAPVSAHFESYPVSPVYIVIQVGHMDEIFGVGAVFYNKAKALDIVIEFYNPGSHFPDLSTKTFQDLFLPAEFCKNRTIFR